MPNYNYDALSPQDFEEITRDLLQAEWGVAIESFKAGRDGGIDLRYSLIPGKSIVVQCKHFIHSGFAALLRHLKKSELPKIAKITPDRYVVVASVGMSPENKNSVVEALMPYIKNASDVIGLNDLDGLLAKHPAVERSNFKLWLTSTSVINRVMHNAEICHTEFEVERIRRKLPLFVQNEAYPRAKEILATSRILVISGAPGIGKTTLAELLLYSNLEEGYEPVVIQGDIVEGKKLYRHGERQIFYYDDFLGQTFLGDRKEYFGRNQDKAVVDFMEMVQSSPYSRFILTTREHILLSALQLSERLENSALVRDRILLKLGHYSFGDRARMVYNHLYFSDLSQVHKAEMLREDFFLDVIKHDHFNPRLIEWLASLQRVNDVPASSYRVFVQGLLDNPAKIWDHAFRNQISESGRSLLLVLYTVDGVEKVADLEPAFAKFHASRVERYNYQSSPLDFEEALRMLEGAFLSITSGTVRFLNPSVKDFVASQISVALKTFDDLLISAVRFQQLVVLWRLVNVQTGTMLRAHFDRNLDSFLSKITTLIATPQYRWENTVSGEVSGHRVDISIEERLGFLAEFCNVERSPKATKNALDAMDHLIVEWSPALVSFWSTPELLRDWTDLDRFLANGGERIRMLVLDRLLLALPRAQTHNWTRLVNLPGSILGWRQRDGQKFYDGLRHYKKVGWQEEWNSCETFDDRQEIIDSLSELSKKKKWKRHFAAALETVSEDFTNYVDDSIEPEQGDGGPSQTVEALKSHSMSEAEVREMFQTLAPTE